MLKKLRIKFICFTMALVFLLLCVIFGMIYGFTARNLETDSLQLMRTVVAPPGKWESRVLDVPVPYLVLQQTAQGHWSAQGSDYYDLTDTAFLNALLQEVTGREARTGILSAYALRYLRVDSPAVCYVFMDISTEQTTLSHLIQTCVSIGVASLLAFWGLSILLSRWAIRPVEVAWEQQKQFIADASHELKTPLAVILTNAELLNDDSYSPQEHHQFSQNVLTMAHQMRHLVEGLLELARLDNVPADSQPVDFSALAENALLPFEPVLFEEGMMLESHILPGLWVRGSAGHLQQLIEIFLDNARKYGSPGVVAVRLDRAGNHALLQIENPGAPLSPKEAKQIFQRFYRADTARSRDGSYGLGLSIAWKITQQHGGKLWAEGTETGNRFCLLLPLLHREAPANPAQLPR